MTLFSIPHFQSNATSVETTAGTNSQSLYSIGSEDSGFYDPENIITPDDLLCFAWQVASGMVTHILSLCVLHSYLLAIPYIHQDISIKF